MDTFLTADSLAGLLADESRLRVVAALVLGARSLDEVRTRADLDTRAAATAMTRLIESGLVVRDEDGTCRLLSDAFADAARVAATSRPRVDPAEGESAEAAKVRRAFVRDGRLVSIPTVRSKRLVLLDMLAQEFEPGRRYSEPMVNLMLGKWHADTAALRRYLVDEGFLDRSAGEYWRSGGTVL
jgi:hypothetical protein